MYSTEGGESDVHPEREIVRLKELESFAPAGDLHSVVLASLRIGSRWIRRRLDCVVAHRLFPSVLRMLVIMSRMSSAAAVIWAGGPYAVICRPVPSMTKVAARPSPRMLL